MKKDTMNRYFAHGYMLCTVIGYLLLMPAYELALGFVSVGATSIYISLGVFLSAAVSKFWGLCAFGWTILFPVVLIAAYILALKSHFLLLWISAILDILVSVALVIYCLMVNNQYGFNLAIADVIISIVILVSFHCVTARIKKDSSVC